jgi:ubiquinone/menaquinone biosynthesis C-methylase UbiE
MIKMNWREEQIQVFDEITRRSKTGFQYIYTKDTIKLFDKIIPKNGKILDLGCGGNYVEKFKRNWYGVDISPETIKSVKRFYKDALVGDVTKKIPYPDNYFDYVLAVSILHHIYKEIQEAMKEVNRVLKPGGEIIIVDHDSKNTQTRLMHHGLLRIVPCKNEKALDIKQISNILIDNDFDLKETKLIKVYAEQQALKPPFVVRLVKVPFLIFFGMIGTKTKGDFLIRAKAIK